MVTTATHRKPSALSHWISSPLTSTNLSPPPTPIHGPPPTLLSTALVCLSPGLPLPSLSDYPFLGTDRLELIWIRWSGSWVRSLVDSLWPLLLLWGCIWVGHMWAIDYSVPLLNVMLIFCFSWKNLFSFCWFDSVCLVDIFFSLHFDGLIVLSCFRWGDRLVWWPGNVAFLFEGSIYLSSVSLTNNHMILNW